MTGTLHWTRTHSGRWQSWYKAADGLRILVATPTALHVLTCGMEKTKRLSRHECDGVTAAKRRAGRLRGRAV